MNWVATQLIDPCGAVTASQPLPSSFSTTTSVPRGMVPVSGNWSLGPVQFHLGVGDDGLVRDSVGAGVRREQDHEQPGERGATHWGISESGQRT